ncbi:thiamine pyrophosphate-dependent dehydrogenase E1 component subunit alpha [Pseudodesulfovibrio sediminis]|uniref:Acetoin:2,6-dichlorophenolindophenol oxidoreductase subunit alpha n=1 Tax=Pseudodesulfovibrio sediminis TaxID=2810563 RepID=A0ABM7P3V4_9BACT|nr:thiamine pyrophosphate-dependent dehydrogenase E1 component subunit alpha [Pseudodesulfovibrio sediminis]BCS87530.1 acetoin:2,6-dichlorophenolindophenol oxidoreductase subunit alpha [Pseudodesulfovibrio sediminis]
MNTAEIPRRDLLETMVLLRCFEEKIVEVYGRQDMKTPVHLYIGQEAIATGVCAHLRKEDYLVTTHRSHAHCLAKGADPQALYAEFYGRVDGCCKGMGGSMHPAFPDLGIIGTSAIVGGGIPHGVGTALASSLRGDDRISVVFFGDGASEEGTFHESLNFAALKKLPVLFVCENNGYATVSPLFNRQPNPDVSERAKGYGITSYCVDGNDVEAVYEAADKAVKQLRQGGGPVFIEAKTYRWKGHVGPGEDWKTGARDREELEQWKKECPLKRYLAKLKEDGVSASDFDALVQKTDAMLDAALEEARKSEFPPTEQMYELLYRKGGC